MKLLLKALKFLFTLFIIIGALFGAFWMIYIKKWPSWTGASLILLLIGLAAGWFWLKKLLIRRRERQFVKQVIEQEKPLAEASGNVLADRISSLERQWADSLDILRESHLGKQGNPLYVLPWYMVLGTSGSGKTSAIRSARLPSPFPEAPRPAGSGTRFCDWWFTEHAILLDTAGKYSTPVMDAADHDEWQRLLALLLAARRKEPLNGLVVAVAADQLLEADGDALAEEGRAIRLRIDELMKVLGAKFPVYILVTKCDQIYGMEQLAKNLPESFFKQPMGVINDDFTRPVVDAIALTLDKIGERLKDLRFMLLDKVQGDKTGLMLLPEEIQKLRPGLENFMLGIFRANPYQESPLMRGVFFSSAQQSGTPVSSYINHLEYTAETPPEEKRSASPPAAGMPAVPAVRNAASDIIFMDILPGTRRGLFLFDFFDWVLTTDRWLNRPLRATVRRFRLNWGLGMISWLALLGGGLGLLSTSYMLNRHVLNVYVAEFKEPTYLTGSILEDILIMDRFRTVILKMEESNKRWWVPQFGLNQSEQAVTRLKRNYCNLFSNFLHENISKKLDENIARITPETPGNERGAYVANIVSRLQFVNARLERRGLEYMKSLPPPSGAFLVLLDSRVTPDLAQHYQDIYLYYSAWQDDLTPAVITKQKLTMLLGKILIGRSGQYDFNWILEWINAAGADGRITLRSFWEGSGAVEYPIIEPCFTVAGKKKVDDFLSQISRVAASSSMLDERIRLFKADYQHRYIAAWERFADDFSEGERIFASNHEMHVQAAGIGIGKIPAELFLERLVKELEPFSGEKTLPPWLKLALEHNRIAMQAREGDFIKDAGGFSKVADKVMENGRQLLEEFKAKKIELPDKNKTQAQLAAVKAYSEFLKSLQGMAGGVTTNATSMRLAVDMFTGGGAVSLSPHSGDPGGGSKPSQFAKVQETLKTFQAQMRRVGEDKIYWDVLDSSLEFFVQIATREAACSLQEQWESQVLAETGAAGESSLQDLLFGAQGNVWKYVKGPAAPFVKASPQGYQPASVMGQRVPFKSEFIDFITRGNTGRQKIRENYGVRVKAYPVHVNKEANPKPQSVLLTLSCGDDLQAINNMNNPVQKLFKWSFKNCADTTLRIKFGSVILERRYGGGRGFINFLSEFKSGEHTFTPEDFPEHENDLKEMDVRQIRLHYLFEGHGELLNLPEYAPLAAPPVIAACQK